MRIPRASMILALVIATSAPPAATMAQPAKPAGTLSADADAMNEKARELFREGTKHYRAEKWAQAEAAFEAAWALTDKKSKGLVNNLGQTEMHLGKFREAAEHLSAARRLAGKDDKQLADIERDLAESRKHVGTLVLAVGVEGAQIVLGGKPVGQAPLVDPLFVDPGKVTLSAFKDGYETAKVELDVAAGQEIPVTLALKKIEAAPVSSATATASTTAPPPPPPRSKVPAYVMGGAGVASLIAGGVLVGVASAAGSDLRADAPRGTNGELLCRRTVEPAGSATAQCDAWRARVGEATALGNAGVGFLVVAGLAAAGTVTYLLWPSSQPARAARWQVAPVIGANAGGVVLHGAF